MPRVARDSAEIHRIRENILSEAIDLISFHGFNGFSMRKLAVKLGFSAKTIYNYYTNKDEIYLMILTRGFEVLNGKIKEAFCLVDDPMEKIKAMNKEYIQFGLKFPHYYNIMFNWDVPKYTDYIGTKLEPIALAEKQEALKLASSAIKVIKEFADCSCNGQSTISFDDLRLTMTKSWVTLHGIVSLINSNVLHETFDQKTIHLFQDELEIDNSPQVNTSSNSIDDYVNESIEMILNSLENDLKSKRFNLNPNS